MFSGITQDMGEIAALDRAESRQDLRVKIRTSLPQERLSLGASVACDGVCLTVTECDSEGENRLFTTEISDATLAVTRLGSWQTGMKVNLEPSLRLQDGIDGHWVTGHVDAVANIIEITPQGGSKQMSFAYPAELRHLLAVKGAVTLDGVSLTVNALTDEPRACFTCNIIAHTAMVTTLGHKQVGDSVNLEVDMLARYLERVLLAKNLQID